MAKKILLVTAGHLSSSPRLIKEAKLLCANGYQVGVVFLDSVKSISILDRKIIQDNPVWEFYPVKWKSNGLKGIKIIISKIVYKLNSIFRFNLDYIQSTSKLLMDEVLNIKADLYIAHHPSVLPAVALASKKYNSKYAYDIEDAFPFVEDGRFFDNPNNSILTIERKYINNACFTTTASPLYSDLYIKLYYMKQRPINLLNVFDVNENTIEYRDRRNIEKVSFYWFSQTVGLNRGLQDVFIAINKLPYDAFELHIRGVCDEATKTALLQFVERDEHKSAIYFHSNVTIQELELRNKEHDIGFALEASTSLNRDLCISNKLLDYLRSGLMIVASNTKGHQLIVNEIKQNAILYNSGDADSLANELLNLIQDLEKIKISKQKSLELARDKYNWTVQSEVWLNKINELLK